MANKVSSVNTLCFSLNKSNPIKLSVSALGSVNSSGWTSGALIPAVYVTTPADGIQDFDFVAVPPAGIVLWIISPISGDGTIELEDWMRGVRVHAATGSLTALLSETSCVVGQGVFSDHLMTAATPVVVAGPGESRLKGGNGGATGRPGGR